MGGWCENGQLARRKAMWTVIYMAKDEAGVMLLREKLDAAGIMTMVRGREEFMEILVPSREVDQAHNIIIDAELQ